MKPQNSSALGLSVARSPLGRPGKLEALGTGVGVSRSHPREPGRQPNPARGWVAFPGSRAHGGAALGLPDTFSITGARLAPRVSAEGRGGIAAAQAPGGTDGRQPMQGQQLSPPGWSSPVFQG